MADDIRQGADPFDEQLAELQRQLSGRGGIGSDARMPVRSAPQDGGDMSSFAARRLLGERAAIPAANVLMGPGELEDPEAEAFRSRTGYEHIPFANAAIGLAALVPAPSKAARDWLTGASADVNGLMREGYQPGADDGSREEQIKRSFNAAGLAGTGSFAGSRLAGDTGSLGQFIGKVGAKARDNPTAMRAIAEAERLNALGLPPDVIRHEVMPLIREGDPRLGGVHLGDDGFWRVEISDAGRKPRTVGPPISKLGREYDHPELYETYPDMPAIDYMRVPGATSYHKPGDPSEIGIAAKAHKPRALAEEVGHEIDYIEGFSQGGSPEDFKPGGSLERLLRPGETPYQGYRRLASEVEKQIVKARIDMDPKALRNMPPSETLDYLRAKNLVPEPPYILRPSKTYPNPQSKSVGRDPMEEPSAFDQAQERGWEDLTRNGTADEMPAWTKRPGLDNPHPSQRGGGPGRAPSDLWPRETNLALAQMYRNGDHPADIAAKLGNRYTEDKVNSQLENLGLVGGRKLPASAVGEWQPDAMAILQSNRIKGMSAADVAKLIEEETGQVTTKNAVIGKLDRLRKSRARDELTEDLAKTRDVKAAGLPISNDDEPPHHSALQPRNDMVSLTGLPKRSSRHP
jgi:hypothetical protein